MDDNKGWTPEQEEKIKDVQATCKRNQWMQNKSRDRDELKYNILENFVTFISLATTGSIFTTAQFCQATFLARIITGFISIMVTFIARYHSTSNFQNQATEHKQAAIRWSSLYKTIIKETAKPIKDRKYAHDFYESVLEEMNLLEATSPAVSSSVLKSYNKLMAKTAEIVEENLPATPSHGKKSAESKTNSILKTSSYIFVGSPVTESAKIRYEIDRYTTDNIS